MPRTPPELLQGTVDILILRAVAWKPMHGYTISQWIGERSRDVLAIEGAALYQALHRLERRKFVSSYWGASENNRRRSTTSSPRAAAPSCAPRPRRGGRTPTP